MDSFKLLGIDLTETTAPVAACAWLEPFVESDLDAAFDRLLTGAAPVSNASTTFAPSEQDVEIAPLVGRR